MLKYQLDSLEGLDESLCALYEEKDGKFTLKVEGVPNDNVDGLKAKVAELLNESKEAKRKAREAEDAARLAADEAARKNGDVAALEKSWKDKMAAREAELQAERDAALGAVRDLTVNDTATRLAAELAVPGSADVLLPHIKNRLALETQDGKPVVRVLGPDGKPSAATVDDLRKEIANDKRFAPLIVASLANGGGASGSKGGRAADKNPFAKGDGFNLTEQARLMRENPALAAQLKSQAS